MFRRVYAQIGFADTQGDLSDEEEADKLTKETSPPTTPTAAENTSTTPRLSLTQFISVNLNKFQIQSKNQPAQSAPPPKAQPRNQPSPSSSTSPSPSPSSPIQSPHVTNNLQIPAAQSSSPSLSNSPIPSHPVSPTPPHCSTPPLQNAQPAPLSSSSSSSSGVLLLKAPSFSQQSSIPIVQPPPPSGTSPMNSSPPFPPSSFSSSPSFSSSSQIPRNLSSSQLGESQLRLSRSSSNLQETSRHSPIPLIPTPPLSSSPVVPVSRSDDRPIPPTANAASNRQSPDSTSSFFSKPSLHGSVKRVSSVPILPPNSSISSSSSSSFSSSLSSSSSSSNSSVRRNSNTPSPLSQPYPSPEKQSQPPSLPISPNQLLMDIDDEEESLISRSSSSSSSSSQAPFSHARPVSQPLPTSSASSFSSHPLARSSPLAPPAHLPSLSSSQSSPSSSTPPASSPSTLPPRPSSQPLPTSSTSLPLSSSLPVSSSPQPSHESTKPPINSDTPNPNPDGLPNTEKPSLRESFSSERSLTSSGSSATGTPEEEVLKTGWLTKQDKAKENWTRQFFALTPTSLLYFEGENENQKGKVSLEGYEVIIVDPEEVEKQFCFMLTHPNKRVFYMHCETRDDMLSWIIAMQEVLDKLKPTGNGPVKLTLVPIAETDPKYELVYAMLHAIRFSVSKMAALPYLDIGLEELNSSTSFSTDKQGSAAVPSSNYPYSFVDYAPKAFRKIREIFGFNCADYLLSLTSQYTLSELPTPGKSGSFFYYSNDRKFMLKTISATEFDNLRQMLPNYFLHILQNPNTLLTRLFGLHKIATDNSRSVIFVVMENIFLDYEMEETYDLKGSTVGRKSDGTSLILKDLDWKRRILLDSERRNSLLFQIEMDCKFLEKNNIMDYSFLLGLRFINHNDEERNKRPYCSIFQKEKGGYQATTEDGGLYDIVYYFGIIDIFTTYNIKKQLEHTYKSTLYETKDAISVVDAVKYAHRFRKFIASICGWQPQKLN